jgi:hypothetical protein
VQGVRERGWDMSDGCTDPPSLWVSVRVSFRHPWAEGGGGLLFQVPTSPPPFPGNGSKQLIIYMDIGTRNEGMNFHTYMLSYDLGPLSRSLFLPHGEKKD